MREFETGYLVLVRKQVKSSIKYGIPQKLLFKKGTIQSPRKGYTKLILASVFVFLWGYRKDQKKSEGISGQDGKYTIYHGATQECRWGGHQFVNMAGPLANNISGKWLGVIRRGYYQVASEDIRWEYETVSDVWPYIEFDSESSDYG